MSLLGLFRNADNAQAFAAGATIYTAGEPGATMYVVIEGAVEILVGNQAVEIAQAGDIVGEMALIEESPRSATVVAKTDCRLVPVDERQFLFLVQQTPFFALHVMRTIAHRLRNMDRRMLGT